MDGGESTAVAIAWTVLVLGWVLPLAHVVLSRTAGPWMPPPGSRCPLGPRAGWAVIVLMCGPVGWLLFHRAQTHRRRRSRFPG